LNFIKYAIQSNVLFALVIHGLAIKASISHSAKQYSA